MMNAYFARPLNLADESRELIPVFHNPQQKCRPSPSAVARTLEYLVVRIKIQKARECLEGGNQVSPKSSLLQGMKAQPLQSLFVGEVTNANYQPFS